MLVVSCKLRDSLLASQIEAAGDRPPPTVKSSKAGECVSYYIRCVPHQTPQLRAASNDSEVISTEAKHSLRIWQLRQDYEILHITVDELKSIMEWVHTIIRLCISPSRIASLNEFKYKMLSGVWFPDKQQSFSISMSRTILIRRMLIILTILSGLLFIWKWHLTICCVFSLAMLTGRNKKRVLRKDIRRPGEMLRLRRESW